MDNETEKKFNKVVSNVINKLLIQSERDSEVFDSELKIAKIISSYTKTLCILSNIKIKLFEKKPDDSKNLIFAYMLNEMAKSKDISIPDENIAILLSGLNQQT